MRKANIIFILSSERSGTNLVRKLLSNHTKISGPSAPHLLKTFNGVSSDLSNCTGNYKQQLLTDVLEVTNHPQHNWNLSSDRIKDVENFNSFLDFFNAVYLEKQRESDSEWVICKENDIFNYVDLLQAFYGANAKFIYLHRDPRDVAVSWMNVPLGFNTPTQAINNWKKENTLCNDIYRSGDYDVAKISYEELLNDTSGEISRLLDFLGLEIENDCFYSERNSFDEKVTKNEYWKNLNKPILKNNQSKFKEMFPMEVIYNLESIIRDLMIQLNYKPLTKGGRLNYYRALRWLRFKRFINRIDESQYKKRKHDSYSQELVISRGKLGKEMHTKYCKNE